MHAESYAAVSCCIYIFSLLGLMLDSKESVSHSSFSWLNFWILVFPCGESPYFIYFFAMKIAGNAKNASAILQLILNFIVWQYQLIKAKPFIFLDFGERKKRRSRLFFPFFWMRVSFLRRKMFWNKVWCWFPSNRKRHDQLCETAIFRGGYILFLFLFFFF